MRWLANSRPWMEWLDVCIFCLEIKVLRVEGTVVSYGRCLWMMWTWDRGIRSEGSERIGDVAKMECSK